MKGFKVANNKSVINLSNIVTGSIKVRLFSIILNRRPFIIVNLNRLKRI